MKKLIAVLLQDHVFLSVFFFCLGLLLIELIGFEKTLLIMLANITADLIRKI